MIAVTAAARARAARSVGWASRDNGGSSGSGPAAAWGYWAVVFVLPLPFEGELGDHSDRHLERR